MPSPPPPSRVTVPIRLSDIDLLGHVNQAVYHDFLQQGRAAMDLESRLEAPRGLVIEAVIVDHRSEVRFADGSVVVETSIDGRSPEAIRLHAEIVKPDGVVAVKASSTLVPRQPGARKPGPRPATDDPAHHDVGVEHVVELRFADFDERGRLQQSAYHAVLEEGRSEALSQLLKQWSGLFVVAHAETVHTEEAVLGDQRIAVHSIVSRLGTSSFELSSDLRVPDGTKVASCRTVFVGWNPEERRSRKLTDAERAALSPAQP